MAPFYFALCDKCERSTKHWHDWNEDQTKFWGVCDECGSIHIDVPGDDEYWVTFTNMPDLNAEAKPGEYHVGTWRRANSLKEALEDAVRWMMPIMKEHGLPPNGIRISEEQLRREAIATTYKEMLDDDYDVFVSKRVRERDADTNPKR